MLYNQPYGVDDPDAPYINGNPSTGTMGSIPPAASIEHPQREIVGVITSSGQTPSAGDLLQLARGIQGNQLNYAVDVGTRNQVQIAPKPPLLSHFAGQRFSVLINVNNDGPSTLNCGLGPWPITYPNQTPLSGGEMRKGSIVSFINDGVGWQMQNVLHGPPPSDTFYVSTTGDDTNDGLTPETAFKTGQGAVDAITARYFSDHVMTLQFADGTYPQGFMIGPSFISAWNILGNLTDPSKVIIDATTVDEGGLDDTRGSAFGVRQAEAMITGMKFKSYQINAGGFPNGLLTVKDCHFTTPLGGGVPLIAGQTGSLRVWGNIKYIGSGPCAGFIGSGNHSMVLLGAADQVITIPLQVTFEGVCNFTSGTVLANGSSVVICSPSYVTWVGGGLVTGPRFHVSEAAGIGYTYNVNFIPGSVAGVKDAASYGWYV